MADETTPPAKNTEEVPPVKPVVEGTPAAPEGVKSEPEKNPLYPRVQELSTKNKELQATLDEHNEAARKKEEEEAKKRGDHEKVIEAKEAEIALLKPDAEKFREYSQARRETLKSELPDQFHSQVDSIESLVDLEDFAKNISELNEGKGAVTAKGEPTGPPGAEPLKKLPEMTAQERRDSHEQRVGQYQK